MESWLQRLFLAASLCISLPLVAQDDDSSVLDDVINPNLERRKIDESKLDTENFEMGYYAGVMSAEDFGTNNSVGVRLSFHISEDWFLEAAYGTSKTSDSIYDKISGGEPLVDENKRDLYQYDLSLGLNLLPGEVYIGSKHAFNTSYYLIAGAGNTVFANDEFFTLNFGAGFRLFATDWAALRMEFRNHLFSHNIAGVDKSVQNLEANIGLSLFF